MRTINPLKFHWRPHRHRACGSTAVSIHHRDNGVSYENSAINIRAISMICRDRQSCENIGGKSVCSHDIFVVRGTRSTHNIYCHLTIMVIEAGQLNGVRRNQLQLGGNLDIDGGRIAEISTSILGPDLNRHIPHCIMLVDCARDRILMIRNCTIHMGTTMRSGGDYRFAQGRVTIDAIRSCRIQCMDSIHGVGRHRECRRDGVFHMIGKHP